MNEYKYYEVEVGTLLKNTHKEFDAYNLDIYNGKYAFYDFNQFASLDLDGTLEYVQTDFQEQPDGYYVIVKGPFDCDDEEAEYIDQEGMVDEYCYDLESVYYCALRLNNKTIENFLNVDFDDLEYVKIEK